MSQLKSSLKPETYSLLVLNASKHFDWGP